MMVNCALCGSKMDESLDCQWVKCDCWFPPEGKIWMPKKHYAALQQKLTEAEEEKKELKSLLLNLHSIVWGESPQLLNEDSGGNAALDMEIRQALSTEHDEEG